MRGSRSVSPLLTARVLTVRALPEPDGKSVLPWATINDDGLPVVSLKVGDRSFDAHIDTGATQF